MKIVVVEPLKPVLSIKFIIYIFSIVVDRESPLLIQTFVGIYMIVLIYLLLHMYVNFHAQSHLRHTFFFKDCEQTIKVSP